MQYQENTETLQVEESKCVTFSYSASLLGLEIPRRKYLNGWALIRKTCKSYLY